ncbi:hypothetical protein B5P19_08590 [Clavibacter sepedonicus]|uniref:Membrane protein n=1 Tax=Clavibacter sepedonicus TaxID=31964 RepID=B0RAT6_CLASE|nr:hypothetical protein B5P19_08590 [Clavibacter sepedonicus]OQJ55487.1 hypothetical protein B5P20_10190 [Clavibacter sepedonicus]CAQ02783.1 putative membrane protein [Clavibacter sepedonicus]
MRIPAPSYRQRLLFGSGWFLLIVWLSSNPLSLLGRRVGVAAAGALLLLVITRLAPGLDIDADRGVLRLRGLERPFTDLVGARIELAPLPRESRYDKPRKRPRRDPLVIRLDLDGGARFRVVLAIGPTDTLSAARTTALVAAVRGSRIQAPIASYDPDGRFTHLNFPGSLDRDDAVKLIEDPQSASALPR